MNIDRFIFKFRNLRESHPTNSVSNDKVANFDRFLFPRDDDLLTQDYQTPAEVGLAKDEFLGVYPVMKLQLDKSSDGPSIDSMVDASKEYTHLQNESRQEVLRKNFNQFIEESALKVTGLNGSGPKCRYGMEYDTKLKACVPIKTQWSGKYWGGGRHHVHVKKNGNGNGNGSHNGNGNGNGNGSGNGSGNGNGGSGNGGGNGGG